MPNKKRLSFAARLDRHAQVAVKVGLRPVLGQQVIMTAPLEALPLVRLITKHAYLAGASLVTTFFDDDESTLLRYQLASDGSFDVATDWLFGGMAAGFEAGAARLGISGANPGLLAGQDAGRVGRAAAARGKAYKQAGSYITSMKVNWSISACATKAWAKTAFPELSERAALKKLWDAIFAASRSDLDDPIAAWNAHNANLKERRRILNEKNYASLHFRGPGTDLIVGLADGHRWAGGESVSEAGITCNPNVPTEEVFTTPHCQRVNGFVTSTKPLSLQGNIVEDIRVRFVDGKIVEATASKGNDALQHLLATDENSCRLGEIALVPHSSPISASGLLFFNTLFDENAACHMAVGQSYGKCVEGGNDMSKEELFARGGNHSNVHVDWMIGSGEIDIDGITASGASEPVMRKGEWAA